MTFIYTTCPMPTFCPLMDRHFAAMQKKLKTDAGAEGDVHLVSVSFDPIDRHAGGAEEARARASTPICTRWTFLTGDRDEIDKFASRFGVSVARVADRRSATSRTTCAPRSSDGDGKLVKVYTGNEWTPDQVLADLRRVGEEIGASELDASSDASATRACRARLSRGFTRSRERRLIARLRTPLAVQRISTRLPYNNEPGGRATLRSFRGVVRHGCAHCLEAALFAAVVLERTATRRWFSASSRSTPRSRAVRLPPARPLGIDRAVARSGPARPAAGVRDAARAGAQLRRSVHRLHRPGHRICRGRTLRSDGRLRLAVGGRPTCGRSSACCSTTRIGRLRRRTRTSSGCGSAIARSGKRSRTQAGVLSGGAVEPVARRIPTTVDSTTPPLLELPWNRSLYRRLLIGIFAFDIGNAGGGNEWQRRWRERDDE